jgi:adenosine deaminase
MICGFGMAGDEKIGHVCDFSWSFDCAAEAGLPFTIHAGEWGGAQSVRETLDAYNPPRIGHGVEAISDPDLVARLADTGVVLECCPVSNVFLGVFPNWKSHPLARLREAGVKVTVSTDDPPFFHTNMSREYEALEQHFGWGEAEFTEINQTALAAAFCDEETRARVAKWLER